MKMEQELQKVDEGVTLPYWDWSYDASRPEQSIVYSADWFGSARSGCVSEGPLTHLKLSYPRQHCLQRSFRSRNMTFVSAATLSQLVRTQHSFKAFIKAMMVYPHGLVHSHIGGDMETGYSSNDPLFYLHHAFLDKVWHEWEWLDSKRRNGYPYDMNKRMPYVGVRVSEVLSAGSYCVKYDSPRAIRGEQARAVSQSDATCVPWQQWSGRPEVDGIPCIATAFKYSGPPPPAVTHGQLSEDWQNLNKISDELMHEQSDLVTQAEDDVTRMQREGNPPPTLDDTPRFNAAGRPRPDDVLYAAVFLSLFSAVKL
jgi:hypothetical protein